MAKVSLRNISKSYRVKGADVLAIKALSLEITDREFLVLAGRPGCGKSTLLRMIAGLEEPSKGEVLIGERNVIRSSPHERDVAIVFANEMLYPAMSVYDNLVFAVRRQKHSAAEIKKRVSAAAEVMGIEDVLKDRPQEISIEKCQRAAISRAIARQPKVFLFDDPLSELDATVRRAIRLELMQLHERLQTTMIYATGDPHEAMVLGDRLVVLNDGVIEQDAPPRVVHDAPANLFIAGFLGDPGMNFVHGILTESRGLLLFAENDGGKIKMLFREADRADLRAFIGKPVVVGIRPHDLVVATVAAAPEKSPTSFPAIIDAVEDLGAEVMLHLQTGRHSLIARATPSGDFPVAGRRVQVEIDPAKTHIFDPVSTDRIGKSA